MTKQEYLIDLRSKIKAIPIIDQDKTINYYDEIIADYMDDGATEQEALERLGSTTELAVEINADFNATAPEAKPVINTLQPKTNSSNNILIPILLVLTSPLWFVLILVAFILMIVLFVVCVLVPIIVVVAVVLSLFISIPIFFAFSPTISIGVMLMTIAILGLGIIMGIKLCSLTSKAVVWAVTKISDVFTRRKVDV